uniref:Zinc finger protein 14-like n=1 Tax=Mastacembelus armatus TaxID=205130 RepID=A0A7N8WQM8_9TELE
MGDVTVEVDEVVMKQEKQEPLPEPLLIILSPPPPFLPVPSQPAMLWHKWLRAFEHYVEALGENELEKLLLKRETVTLATALVIGKEVESTLDESELFDFHEVSVDIGDDSDPPVHRKAKRGRPRRGEKRTKTKPQSTKISTSSSYKDNYYYSNDKMYYSDNDEDRSAVETNPARTRNKVEDYDEDFAVSSTNLKGPYCPICINRCFRDANKLARHMRTHTKEKPFTCPVCTVTFSQSYHLTRHLRNQHGAGQHVCSTCGKSLESFAELKNHKRTHMSQVLSCPDCPKNFTNTDSFFCHLTSHSKYHATQTEEQSNDNYGAKSQDGGSKKQKVPSKTKIKGHFCPICVGRGFRGPNKLARHMRTHTKEKPFTCPICALTFSQSYHMTRHLRNQHSLGQYLCSKCGKSLSTWLELKQHNSTEALVLLFSYHTSVLCLYWSKALRFNCESDFCHVI